LEQLWKKFLAPALDAMARLPKWQIIAFLFVVSAMLAVADYALGEAFSLVVFFAVPVVAMAWLVGRPWAYAQAFLMAGLLMLATYAMGAMGEHSMRTFAPYVNIANRLIFYVFLIELLTRIKYLQQNLESLAESRARALAQEAARSVRLERELMEAGEREQRRIGQDLHDGLCQHLTGTALASQVLVEKLASSGPAQAEARRLVELIEDGISLARGIAKGLYPIDTESDGLMQALEEFTANSSDLFGIKCRFSCDTPVLIRTPSTAAHLYRIAQEAVSNAVRHGRATEIEIALEETDTGVRLMVTDNGVGLPDPLPEHDGLGLRTMADRARSIGGQFSIKPGMLGGAEVMCLAPGRWISCA
jgi:signal transduction histidine kinase